MTDREITLALFGLLGCESSMVIHALVTLKREVPLEVILECEKEMTQMVSNLGALIYPKLSQELKETLKGLELP